MLEEHLRDHLRDHLRLRAPLIVQFEITPACNNNCGFCYNFWEYDSRASLSRKSEISQEKIHGLMDALLENEVLAVCFTGGEPFLAGETLFELIERAKTNNIYTSINTNGRLIREREAERLKELGLNSALISLHGDSPIYHEDAVGCSQAFEETISGIRNLANANVPVTVNYVSTQKNVDRIIQTAEMLKDLRIKSMTVTPLLPFAGVKEHETWCMKKDQFRQYFNALASVKESGLKIDSTLPIAPCILRDMFPEDYEKYLEVLSPRVCMAGVTFAVVSPEGVNRACIQAPELKEYGENIREMFGEGWKKANNWSKLELLPKECSEQCHALACCGGGCRTSSLAQNRSVEGRTMYMGEPISKEDAYQFIKRMEVDIDNVGTAGVNTDKADIDNVGTAGVDAHVGIRSFISSFRKYKKVKRIQLRTEDFGGVIANTSRQSFVFLDHEGIRIYNQLPDEFSIDSYDKGLATLYAAGILLRGNKTDIQKYGVSDASTHIDVSMHIDVSTHIIHASKLYPRLAGGFPSGLPSDDKVRMLRADTGERIYF